MESDFSKLSPAEQKQIAIAQNYADGFINDESPEKQTFDFETDGGRRKVAFKLVELPDKTKRYEFAYMLYVSISLPLTMTLPKI